MFYFVDSIGYTIGVCIALFIVAIFCMAIGIKKSKQQKALNEALNKFNEMANGKYYDDIVAIMKKPQEEIEKTCPNTGSQIKVAKWKGGYYYWEQYRYDIVVVFEEDGKFNNVKMYE